jgi:hypothetical protein
VHSNAIGKFTFFGTLFYDDAGFFVEGHNCDRDEYKSLEFVYPNYEVSFLQVVPVSVNNADTEEPDVSAQEGSPFQTQAPAPTPLGRTIPTVYTLGTNLTIPALWMHSTGTFTSSDSFDYSLFFEASCFNESLLLVESSRLPESALLLPTRTHALSLPFSPSNLLPSPTPRVSPVPTESEFIPREGFSQSFIASLTLSVSQVASESLMISYSEMEELRVITVTTLINDSLTVTQTVLVERTRVMFSWVTVFFSNMPIYITVSRVVIIHVYVPTDVLDGGGLSDGALIGISTGAAVVLLIMAISVVVMVRMTRKAPNGANEQDVDPATVSVVTLDDEIENSDDGSEEEPFTLHQFELNVDISDGLGSITSDTDPFYV